MECQNCSTSFRPSREWQVFCSKGCKRTFNYSNREICFYCGTEGITRDHIHPFSVRPGVKKNFIDQEFVYACNECNGTLTDTIFSDILERIQYLIQRFIAKYGLDKKAVVWDEYELSEMGHGLKAQIKAMLKRRQQAEARLMYLEARKAKLMLSYTEEV